MSTFGAAASLGVVSCALILVAILPQLLGYPFCATDSVLVGEVVLCLLLIPLLWIMRRLPYWGDIFKTWLLLVLVWTPFAYFLVDTLAGSSLSTETNVAVGTSALVWLLLSLNLVRKEVGNAPSLLGLWVSSMGVVGHFGLAFGWRYFGEKTTVFWVVFCVLVAVVLGMTLTMVCMRGCWTYVSKRAGLTWPKFYVFRVFAVALNNLGVLALSQSIDHGAKTALVPIVACFIGVFWSFVFLDSVFRILWRLAGPSIDVVPTPQKSTMYPVLTVAGIGTLLFGTFGGVTWLALVGVLVWLVFGTTLVRNERTMKKTYAFDLAVVGALALCASTVVVFDFQTPSAAIMGMLIAAALAPIVFRLKWNRSPWVVLCQVTMATVFVVFIATTRQKDDVARGSYAVLGLWGIVWTAYWLMVSMLAPSTRPSVKQGLRQDVSWLFKLSCATTLALFVTALVLMLLGNYPDVFMTVFGFAVGAWFVTLALGLMEYRRYRETKNKKRPQRIDERDERDARDASDTRTHDANYEKAYWF